MIKTFLTLFVSLVLFSHSAIAGKNRAGNPRAYKTDVLLDVFKLSQSESDVPFDSILQACPKRDCIPSIDQPSFLPAQAVNYLQDDDLLLVLNFNGVTRAYPTRILDHHEIVNDLFAGDPVVISYCPLCGSGLAFSRELDGQILEFGVSSLLHNSDLVMYDRETNSLWQQITGHSFAGELRGHQLRSLTLTIVEWKSWRESFPQAQVLTVKKVQSSIYRKQAYEGYAQSSQLFAPVSATDARLHPKQVVYALEIEEQALAIDGDWLSGVKQWSTDINGQSLHVSQGDDGEVIAVLNDKPVAITRLYWFAWYSFHPDTALINGN